MCSGDFSNVIGASSNSATAPVICTVAISIYRHCLDFRLCAVWNCWWT